MATFDHDDAGLFCPECMKFKYWGNRSDAFTKTRLFCKKCGFQLVLVDFEGVEYPNKINIKFWISLTFLFSSFLIHFIASIAALMIGLNIDLSLIKNVFFLLYSVNIGLAVYPIFIPSSVCLAHSSMRDIYEFAIPIIKDLLPSNISDLPDVDLNRDSNKLSMLNIRVKQDLKILRVREKLTSRFINCPFCRELIIPFDANYCDMCGHEFK